MSHDTRRDIRRRCKLAGIPFATVEETYQELRILHRENRRHSWEMRQRAWEEMVPKGCHPFWRHGWHVRYPYAFGEGDVTNIPGFDRVAQAISWEFPELNRDGDPTTALYEFLAQPHDRMPTAEDTWQEAADIVLGDLEDSETETVPF